MALTRKLLEGMALTEAQVDAIIDAHMETVRGLQADVVKYKADADKLPDVQKELDNLREQGDGGWQQKYTDLKTEHDSFVATVNAQKETAAKEAAARSFFSSKGIVGKSLDIAMRGCTAEVTALVIEDGKIKDTTTLDDLVKGDFASLVATERTEGADTPKPPTNTASPAMTEADIYKMENGRYVLSASQRQAELAKLLQKGE